MPEQKEDRFWVGMIAERRASAHPWADFTWRVVALVPGLGDADGESSAKQTESGDGWDRFLIGRLAVTLHRKETEAYVHNLVASRPAIYVVLDLQGDAEAPAPRLATASPYEAQDYLDSGECMVEALPIPEALRAWIEDFVARHHKAETFKKRQRGPATKETPQFGKELHPIEAAFYKRKGVKTPK